MFLHKKKPVELRALITEARGQTIQGFAAAVAVLALLLLVSDYFAWTGFAGSKQLPFIILHTEMLAGSLLTAGLLRNLLAKWEGTRRQINLANVSLSIFTIAVVIYAVLETHFDLTLNSTGAGFIITIITLGTTLSLSLKPALFLFTSVYAFLTVVVVLSSADGATKFSILLDGGIAAGLAVFASSLSCIHLTARFKNLLSVQNDAYEKEKLLLETNHRIKNNFATMEALLTLQLDKITSENPKDLLD